MLKPTRETIVTAICIAGMTCSGNLLAEQYNVYAGLDVLKSNFSTQDGYGRNIFAKNPTTLNGFIGYNLTNNFFVEIGYKTQETKRRTERLGAGEFSPGSTTAYAGGTFQKFRTKFKLEFPYLGVGASYPLTNDNKSFISVLGGLSLTKLKAQWQIVGDDVTDPYTATMSNVTRISFHKRKVSPMLRIGIQHSFNENYGFRISGTFHKLSNFNLKSEENPNGVPNIRLKNGYTFGVGIFYNF